ncbi:hypothetical protein RB623_11700 [Mesorhizobium sp. LHD-90]|uniref:hypothetical protein n=1 Tax=Mesorhizobium sp. LHD-90 TaxID=3071414 RepID=UPI0027E10156|nr:hypothetical protein [Mesorhizobium sp. LHD-90]MDQ6434709.1 hypothetical protein [Mesorhizobium sp. LHD-90]
MGHVVKELDWCTIDIDTTNGFVFFQERWKYEWLLTGALSAWTYAEKKKFHDSADRAIWSAWSFKAKLSVSGTSAFARRFIGKGIPINLDVRWVLKDQHWDVKVYKVAKGTYRTSNVNWEDRIIEFDTNDFDVKNFENGDDPDTKQIAVAHEFGHAVGNSKHVSPNRGDEYKPGHVNVHDHASIMNHGNQLRSRHFQTIIEQMDTMIPDTTFAIKSLQ